MVDEKGRELYPMEVAADKLGVKRSTVYKLIDEGELIRVKIGRRALVTAESLDAYVRRLIDAGRNA